MTKRLFLCLLAVLAVIVSAGNVHAQVEQGGITGRVFDEAGGVVPGATVIATQTGTGMVRETVTNGSGVYTVPYLSVGTYDVTATLAGFTGARVTDVTIRVGLTATVDLSLKVASVQTEITVSAHVTHLELQSPALGNVVTGRQMIELPIVGRNPYSLVTLAPGVVDRGNTGMGPIINGARSNSTAVLLDGAEQRNSTTNDLNYSPPLESVQEFKVVTNGLSAEFGRTGGGVITAATRSGTNTLHGSGYAYMRRDRFNANSWTNKRNGVAKGKEHINQYGFTLGGPVMKDRMFFFVNVERSNSLTPDNVIRTVPTMLQRSGDFSQTRTSNGQLIVIYDPLTTRSNPAGGFIRDPFPGNVIPANRIDPIAKAILEHYPAPTNDNATQNFVRERSRTSTSLPVVARVDYARGRHRLFGSYRQSNSEDSSPTISVAFPDPGTNGEAGTRANDRLSSVLSDTIVFRSNLVAEVRFGYTRNRFTTSPATLGLDFGSLGIGAADPALKAHSAIAMFPRIEVGGGIDSLGMNRAGLIDDLEGTRELQAHVTWLRGAHTIKSGLQLARMGFDVFRPEYPSGQYVFGNGFTQGPNPAVASTTGGFGFATFLLGQPTGGQITGDPRFLASQSYFAPYVQDDWKVTNRLTVMLGVRYDYQSPWIEKDDQLTFFDEEATDPLTGRKGIVRLVGRDGGSRYQTDPDRNNIAPRLGFAWQFAEAMVLRGGYGVGVLPGKRRDRIGAERSRRRRLSHGDAGESCRLWRTSRGAKYPAARRVAPQPIQFRILRTAGDRRRRNGDHGVSRPQDTEGAHVEPQPSAGAARSDDRGGGVRRDAAPGSVAQHLAQRRAIQCPFAGDGAGRAGAESILRNHPDRRLAPDGGDDTRVTTAETLSAIRRRHALPRFDWRVLVQRVYVAAGASIRARRHVSGVVHPQPRRGHRPGTVWRPWKLGDRSQ